MSFSCICLKQTTADSFNGGFTNPMRKQAQIIKPLSIYVGSIQNSIFRIFGEGNLGKLVSRFSSLTYPLCVFFGRATPRAMWRWHHTLRSTQGPQGQTILEPFVSCFPCLQSLCGSKDLLNLNQFWPLVDPQWIQLHSTDRLLRGVLITYTLACLKMKNKPIICWATVHLHFHIPNPFAILHWLTHYGLWLNHHVSHCLFLKSLKSAIQQIPKFNA